MICFIWLCEYVTLCLSLCYLSVCLLCPSVGGLFGVALGAPTDTLYALNWLKVSTTCTVQLETQCTGKWDATSF